MRPVVRSRSPAPAWLGVEIGGTKLQVGVGDGNGRLHHLVCQSVARGAGANGILRQLQETIPPILHRYPVRAIGVGFGGPVDSPRGGVITSHQVAGWDGFPLRRWFERQFAVPTMVENDSNCAAFAEARCGAGRGFRAVFYTNIGTGIGGGFVLDGVLYQGRFGAMEIGHTWVWRDGREHTVESLASGLAIERGVSTPRQAARLVGVAVANVVTLLNPDVVVVGGGVGLAGKNFLGPLRTTVRRLVFAPFRGNYRIVPSRLRDAVVVVGAILLAAQSGQGRGARKAAGHRVIGRITSQSKSTSRNWNGGRA